MPAITLRPVRSLTDCEYNFRTILWLLTGHGDFVNNQSSGLLQTWQDSMEANVDATNPMEISIYIPDEARRVHKALLRIKKRQFRADATTAASGGGQTTSSGGGTTTSSGGGINQSSGASTITTTASGGADTPTSAVAGGLFDTGQGGAHNHTVGYSAADTEVVSGHAHSYYMAATSTGNEQAHTHTGPDHSHDVTILNHTHGMEHTHNITVASHDHSISNHSHTVANHTHDLSYGIYQATLPSDAGFTVEINGVDRTSALGGPFAGDQDALDITQWFVRGQWNDVAIGCGAGILVRIQAQIFMQAFIRPIGYAERE